MDSRNERKRNVCLCASVCVCVLWCTWCSFVWWLLVVLLLLVVVGVVVASVVVVDFMAFSPVPVKKADKTWHVRSVDAFYSLRYTFNLDGPVGSFRTAYVPCENQRIFLANEMNGKQKKQIYGIEMSPAQTHAHTHTQKTRHTQQDTQTRKQINITKRTHEIEPQRTHVKQMIACIKLHQITN